MCKIDIVNRYNLFYFEISTSGELLYMDKDVAEAFGLDIYTYQDRLIALLKRNKAEVSPDYYDVVFKIDKFSCGKLIEKFKYEFAKELITLELEG